uniref:Macro domain-containing protein n=1 Tax=Macrostomum lignano TaxID=282301 RepID=A0A1I8IVH3_9PLAT
AGSTATEAGSTQQKRKHRQRKLEAQATEAGSTGNSSGVSEAKQPIPPTDKTAASCPALIPPPDWSDARSKIVRKLHAAADGGAMNSLVPAAGFFATRTFHRLPSLCCNCVSRVELRQSTSAIKPPDAQHPMMQPPNLSLIIGLSVLGFFLGLAGVGLACGVHRHRKGSRRVEPQQQPAQQPYPTQQEQQQKQQQQKQTVAIQSVLHYSDMNEEMRTEAMELCVTACEKFASNNEASLTVPSAALAPTRSPVLFQQTSNMPPVPWYLCTRVPLCKLFYKRLSIEHKTFNKQIPKGSPRCSRCGRTYRSCRRPSSDRRVKMRRCRLARDVVHKGAAVDRPEFQRHVIRAGGQQLAAGIPLDSVDFVGVAAKRFDWRVGAEAAHLDALIGGAAGKGLIVFPVDIQCGSWARAG